MHEQPVQRVVGIEHLELDPILRDRLGALAPQLADRRDPALLDDDRQVPAPAASQRHGDLEDPLDLVLAIREVVLGNPRPVAVVRLAPAPLVHPSPLLTDQQQIDSP
jgi:hypothetical protein